MPMAATVIGGGGGGGGSPSSSSSSSSLLPVTVDGIVYEAATAVDETPVLDLMLADFCLSEPLNEVKRIGPEEAAPPFALCVRRALADGLSFKATDAATGVVVGAQLSFAARAADAERDEQEARGVVGLVPERLKPLARFVAEVAAGDAPDVFQEYGVDKYVDFFVVNIREDYRGRQIAQRMMNLSYDVFRQNGFRIVKVLATNPRTEHLFRNKHGFKEVASYRVLDYMHDGKPYFEGVKELETAYTFVKDLGAVEP